MILIAESGSTKTDWVCLEKDGNIAKLEKTAGINPQHFPGEDIRPFLQKNVFSKLTNLPDSIFFYGAGCGTDENRSILLREFESICPEAHIEVNSDMLAAARAMSGRNRGIICILGTGSNSCLYDGEKLVLNVPPLGYLLGDEGSGAYIGKIFLRNYLRNKFESDLNSSFRKEYPFSSQQLLDIVYKRPMPNKFLASLLHFIHRNIDKTDIKNLVEDSFSAFIEYQVSEYQEYKSLDIHFTGSVAYHFQSILKKKAADNSIRVGEITDSPLDGLINFHLCTIRD